jgi:hypothetical protein
VDARSDLWSLAATVYQMVTGRSPKIIRFDLLPAALTKVLGKALEDAKDARFQSAREFREAIDGVRNVSRRLATDAVDLSVGECAECRTPNPAARKFCSECAASLRVPCLQCSQEIPVWDKVCPECGARQQEIIESRRADFDAACATAETLVADYEYQAARELLGDWKAVGSRFGDIASRASAIAERIVLEEQRQCAARDAHLEEARAHSGAYDYASAIRALEAIPLPMRTSEIVSLLERVSADGQEVEKLLVAIRQAIAGKHYEGLLPLVTRACELTGDRRDLALVRAQLIERESQRSRKLEEARREARDLALKGEYGQACRVLEALGPSFAGDVDSEAATYVGQRVKATSLLSAIKDKIQSKHVQGLLPLVRDAATLLPQRSDLKELLSDLEGKERSRRERVSSIYEQAVATFNTTGQAEGARRQLEAIRPELSESELRFLGLLTAAAEAERHLAEAMKSSGNVAAGGVAALKPVATAAAACISLSPANIHARKVRKQILQVIEQNPEYMLDLAQTADGVSAFLTNADEEERVLAEKALLSCRASLETAQSAIPVLVILRWLVICLPLGVLLLLARFSPTRGMRRFFFGTFGLVGGLTTLFSMGPIAIFASLLRSGVFDLGWLLISVYAAGCGSFAWRYHSRATASARMAPLDDAVVKLRSGVMGSDSTRQVIETLVRETFGSTEVTCPVCQVKVRAKRLMHHYETHHA